MYRKKYKGASKGSFFLCLSLFWKEKTTEERADVRREAEEDVHQRVKVKSDLWLLWWGRKPQLMGACFTFTTQPLRLEEIINHSLLKGKANYWCSCLFGLFLLRVRKGQQQQLCHAFLYVILICTDNQYLWNFSHCWKEGWKIFGESISRLISTENIHYFQV